MTNPLSILCIIGSCVSLQLGAALAVQLFPAAGSWATASLRLLIAAAVLLVITRPQVRRWDRAQWSAIVLFGLSFGAMNGCFYAAIARIPLGSAVTIEFIGPLILATVLSRTLRDGACVLLAACGLVLLGWNSLSSEPLMPTGVAYVLAAAFFWACYILSSKKAGQLVPGQGGLAVALVIGGTALLPLGWRGSLTILSDTHLLALAIGTGLLASLIPYSLELIALRSLEANVFSILISLEPVFAAFFGWLLINETITPLKVVAIALVVSASVIQTLPARSGAAHGSTKPHTRKESRLRLRRVPGPRTPQQVD